MAFLGYQWPFTQVKTWAYGEGTRCLRHRIVRNWAGLKTYPQSKGGDARPSQSERMLVQLPLCDLRFALVDKGSDARPPQSDLRSSRSAYSTSLVRGAMHIKGYIAIQTKSPCISDISINALRVRFITPCISDGCQ